jgi:uncharacterized phage-associated protein
LNIFKTKYRENKQGGKPMKTAEDAMQYLADRYYMDYQLKIDEMKVHKMLYFIQKESLALYDRPFLEEEFYGWRYGPVLPDLRSAYKSLDVPVLQTAAFTPKELFVLNKVYETWGSKDSWSLSRLSCSDYAWKHARVGKERWEKGGSRIELNDIRVDALILRNRRERLGIL